MKEMKKKVTVFFAGLIFINFFVVSLNVNYITNGDFEDCNCPSSQSVCTFSSSNAVPGWSFNPSIELGYGQIYTTSFRNKRVLKLSANSCFEQTVVNLSSGSYQLIFGWGAPQNSSLSFCQFSVQFNGKESKFFPTDFTVRQSTINSKILNGTETKIKFCGIKSANHSTSFGAFIKSVRLIKKLPTNYAAKWKIRFTASEQGTFYFDFNHSILASANIPVQLSDARIYWDEVEIATVLASDDISKNVRLKIDATKGFHILVFATQIQNSQRNSGLQSHRDLQRQVFLTKCEGLYGSDLIINGKFQEQQIDKAKWEPILPFLMVCPICYFNQKWNCDLFAPQIEGFPDYGRQNCFKQTLSLNPGMYQLQFDWSADQFHSLETSQFDVRINDQVIQRYFPTDFYVKYNQTLQLWFDSFPNSSFQLKFCGKEPRDSYGAAVTNIRLALRDNCSIKKQVENVLIK